MPEPTRKEQYRKYLVSAKWRRLRQEVLERDGRVCTKCGTAENLNIHHLTYKNLFDEALEDLVTLCVPCHGAEHERKKEKRRQKRSRKARRRKSGICRTCGTFLSRPHWDGGGGHYCSISCRAFGKKAGEKIGRAPSMTPLWRRKNQALIAANDELHLIQKQARERRAC